MNNINQQEIIDRKIVNDTTYNLVLCKDNGMKMKLWIPDYLMTNAKADENNRKSAEQNVPRPTSPQKNISSLEDKVNQIYSQLSRANDTELLELQKQIVKLNLKDLPTSQKSEINTMIVKMMRDYKTTQKTSPQLVQKLRQNILREEMVNKRRDQLSVLFCLEKEINLVAKCRKKITVENFVDLELLPFDFSYINANIAGADVSFLKHPPIGCDCIGKRICLLNNCCPEMFNSQPTYNEDGQVMIPSNMPIYECNKNCKCSKSCANRIVQRGSNIKFIIFRTEDHEWGVQAAQSIKKGTFVVEYVGEIVKRNQIDQFHHEEKQNHYLFDLNFNKEDCLYTINSWKHGNISRFIGHSCAPNLHAYSVWIDSSDPNIYHVALFASQDICNGEKLTFLHKNTSVSNNCKCDSCKVIVFQF
ncbi:histone-lysine N-methyltransferase SUV39H2-like [Planococcus citri]|uniref:histone-lysine N-methyltransferase SUV39H2-like n=1 Tax=Planococcus citri TaxID=170843 RepID=UPI0031F819EF